ncbi:hypothetical protein BDEG_23399 [Batrachochytrium dendrobatidis JEL423]|uniref:Uncharacterized protein n=1 Tax=Batrachochytrium dendrobatidis (strain JEL423) TaxID=403673 RepID=A0A177WIR9_BATDL|nr:hypothetical protein BDEG_23399 [Batrachochytrium dendrobatidis JEL423]
MAVKFLPVLIPFVASCQHELYLDIVSCHTIRIQEMAENDARPQPQKILSLFSKISKKFSSSSTAIGTSSIASATESMPSSFLSLKTPTQENTVNTNSESSSRVVLGGSSQVLGAKDVSLTKALDGSNDKPSFNTPRTQTNKILNAFASTSSVDTHRDNILSQSDGYQRFKLQSNSAVGPSLENMKNKSYTASELRILNEKDGSGESSATNQSLQCSGEDDLLSQVNKVSQSTDELEKVYSTLIASRKSSNDFGEMHHTSEGFVQPLASLSGSISRPSASTSDLHVKKDTQQVIAPAISIQKTNSAKLQVLSKSISEVSHNAKQPIESSRARSNAQLKPFQTDSQQNHPSQLLNTRTVSPILTTPTQFIGKATISRFGTNPALQSKQTPTELDKTKTFTDASQSKLIAKASLLSSVSNVPESCTPGLLIKPTKSGSNLTQGSNNASKTSVANFVQQKSSTSSIQLELNVQRSDSNLVSAGGQQQPIPSLISQTLERHISPHTSITKDTNPTITDFQKETYMASPPLVKSESSASLNMSSRVPYTSVDAVSTGPTTPACISANNSITALSDTRSRSTSISTKSHEAAGEDLLERLRMTVGAKLRSQSSQQTMQTTVNSLLIDTKKELPNNGYRLRAQTWSIKPNGDANYKSNDAVSGSADKSSLRSPTSPISRHNGEFLTNKTTLLRGTTLAQMRINQLMIGSRSASKPTFDLGKNFQRTDAFSGFSAIGNTPGTSSGSDESFESGSRMINFQGIPSLNKSGNTPPRSPFAQSNVSTTSATVLGQGGVSKGVLAGSNLTGRPHSTSLSAGSSTLSNVHSIQQRPRGYSYASSASPMNSMNPVNALQQPSVLFQQPLDQHGSRINVANTSMPTSYLGTSMQSNPVSPFDRLAKNEVGSQFNSTVSLPFKNTRARSHTTAASYTSNDAAANLEPDHTRLLSESSTYPHQKSSFAQDVQSMAYSFHHQKHIKSQLAVPEQRSSPGTNLTTQMLYSNLTGAGRVPLKRGMSTPQHSHAAALEPILSQPSSPSGSSVALMRQSSARNSTCSDRFNNLDSCTPETGLPKTHKTRLERGDYKNADSSDDMPNRNASAPIPASADLSNSQNNASGHKTATNITDKLNLDHPLSKSNLAFSYRIDDQATGESSQEKDDRKLAFSQRFKSDSVSSRPTLDYLDSRQAGSPQNASQAMSNSISGISHSNNFRGAHSNGMHQDNLDNRSSVASEYDSDTDPIFDEDSGLVRCFKRSESGMCVLEQGWDSEVYADPRYNIWRRAVLEILQQQTDFPLIMPTDLFAAIMDDFIEL